MSCLLVTFVYGLVVLGICGLFRGGRLDEFATALADLLLADRSRGEVVPFPSDRGEMS